jgi:hypothetical protein
VRWGEFASFRPDLADAGRRLLPSPKRDDLHRDGRFVLHSFPADDNEDAFYVTGRAQLVTDQDEVNALATQFAAERDLPAPPTEITTWELFVLDIGSVSSRGQPGTGTRHRTTPCGTRLRRVKYRAVVGQGEGP